MQEMLNRVPTETAAAADRARRGAELDRAGAGARAADRGRRPAGSRRTGEIPADVIEAMHDARLFRMLIPRAHRRRGGRARDLLPGDGSRSPAPTPASRWCLGQNSGVSMAAAYLDPKVARELFGDPRADGRHRRALGRRQGDRHRRRLSRDRALAVRQRQPAFALARRPRHRLRAGRQPAARPQRQAARAAHHVLSEIEGEDHRHLAGDRAARHRQRRLRGQRPVRAGGLQLHPRIRRRPARDRAALSLLDLQHVRHGVLRGGARHRALGAHRLHRAGEGQDAAFADSTAGQNNFIQINIGLSDARLGAARAYVLDYYAQALRAGVDRQDHLLLRSASPAAASPASRSSRRARWSISSITPPAPPRCSSAIPYERRFRDLHTVTQQSQAHMTNFEALGQMAARHRAGAEAVT